MIERSEPVTAIVVGVGGNPATLRAVTWAAREAARRHLSLDLVQVLPPSHHDHVRRFRRDVPGSRAAARGRGRGDERSASPLRTARDRPVGQRG